MNNGKLISRKIIQHRYNNPRFSEKSYFGIGYFNEGKSIIDSSGVSYHNFKIPITYGYSSSQTGFSPTFCAGVSIRNYEDQIFSSCSFSPGIKYNFKYFFLKAYIDFEFLSVILIPVKYSSFAVKTRALFNMLITRW